MTRAGGTVALPLALPRTGTAQIANLKEGGYYEISTFIHSSVIFRL
jgi:hypothetical protein